MISLVAVLAAMVLATSPAAAALTWSNGAVDSIWSITSGSLDWNGSAWVNNNDAIFDVPGTTVGAVTLGSGITTNSITFNTSGYTVAGGGFTLTNTGSITVNAPATITAPIALGAAQSWNVASGQTLTASGGISGSGMALTKSGPGILFLGGPGTFTGKFTVNAGTAEIDAGGSIANGSGGIAATGPGTLNVAGGTITSTGGGFDVGNAAGDNASFNMSSGSISCLNSDIVIGANGTSGSASWNQSGGTITDNTGNHVYTGMGTGSTNINFSGGLFNLVGQNGSVTFTIGGRNVTSVTVGGTADVKAAYLRYGWATGLTSTMGGTMSLNGGTLEVNRVGHDVTVSQSVFNFNGGTLKALATNTTTFMTGLATANVRENGAVIDSNSFNVTISQALLHSGSNAIDGGLYKLGSGTLTVSGANTYNGATTIGNGVFAIGSEGASAGAGACLGVVPSSLTPNNVVISGGTLAVTNSLAINSNRGISVGPSSGSGSGSIDVAPGQTVTYGGVIANNASGTGGLSKVDTGILVLNGNNTYGGPTFVNGGKLYMNGTNATSGITVADGATLAGSGAATSAVATVGSNNGGTLEAGYSGSGSLALGGLTFVGTSAINVINVGQYSATPAINVSNVLTTPSTPVNVSIAGSLTGTSGTLHVLQYGSLGGSLYNFNLLSPVSSGRNVYHLANDGNYVDFTYSTDSIFWAGTGNGAWDLASTGNWLLNSTSSATTFQSGDKVVFDDRAIAYSGSASQVITISGTNVYPSAVIFSNSAASYTLQGGFGISGTNNASLTINGGGKVTLACSNGFTGGTTISAGTLQYGVSNALLSSGPVTLNGAAAVLDLGGFSPTVGAVTLAGGTIQNGTLTGASYGLQNGLVSANLAGSGIVLNKTGSGTLIMGGVNTFTGKATVSAGTLQLGVGGSISNGSGQIVVDGLPGSNATLYVSGGSINSTANGLNIGATAGNVGSVVLSAGTINLATGDLTVGSANNVITSWAQSGGYLSTTTVNHVYTGMGTGTGLTTTLNFTGGIFQVNALNTSVTLSIGGRSQTLMTVGGTAFVDDYQTRFGWGSDLTSTDGGTLSLTGGTLLTNRIYNDVPVMSSQVDFNGGTLQARQTTTTFISGLSSANVRENGAIIDSNGFNITISQAFLHSGSNVFDGGLTKLGAGALTLTGTSSYTGATVVNAGSLVYGVNNALPATGAITVNNGSILNLSTFTGNAGTVTLANGMIAGSSGALNGTSYIVQNGTISANLGDQTGSPLQKSTTGTVVLSGNNSFTGGTTVNAGALYLNGFNSMPSISVSGAATLGGSGSAPSANVTVASGGILDFSQNSSQFSLSGLTFQGNARVNIGNLTNYQFSGALNVAGFNTLTASGSAGSVKFYLSGSAPVGAGSVVLVNYGGDAIQGTGTSAFAVNTAGLGTRVIASLSFPANQIDVNYTIDHPVWSGAGNGVWSTATQSPKNWVLASDGTTPTDFLTNDAVVFNDNATGTTAVSIIGTGDVQPLSVTFGNTSQSYTLSGIHGIVGPTGLTINGGGAVTITNSNGYTGGTALASGVLNLGNSAALGMGVLTIGGGSLDNTSGAAMTLAGNPAQSWTGSFAFVGSYPLNTGTGAVSISNSPTVVVSASTLTVGGIISGSDLNKDGPGTLVLTAANNYTGATTITAGTLQLGTGQSGQDGSIATTTGVTNYGALVYNLAGSQTASYAISGFGSLLKAGVGKLTLTNVGNNFSGGITVSAGTLTTTGIGNVGNNAITLGDDNTGANNIVLQTTNAGGGTSPFWGTGTITVANSGTGSVLIDLGPQNASFQNSFEFDRAVTVQSDATVGGAYFGFYANNYYTMSGSGALTLKTTNTGRLYVTVNGSSYTGPVTLAPSAWVVAGPGNANVSFGSGQFAMQNSSTLDLSTFAGVRCSVTDLTDAGATGDAVNLGSGSLTVNSAAGSTFAGAITGNGTLNVTGTGKFVLAGSNTYAGATTINGGTLQLGSTSAIPYGAGKGNVTVNSSGVLDVAGRTINVNGIGGSGVVDNSIGSGTLLVGNNNATSTFSGTLQNTAGSLALTKVGSGTFTLGSTNFNFGPTTVQAGVLHLGAEASVPGNVNVSGGTLDVDAYSDSAGTVTLSSGAIVGSGGTLSASNFQVQSGAISANLGDESSTKLVKTTSGTVVLSGTNSYLGGTIVSNGTLIVTTGAAIADGTSLTVGDPAGFLPAPVVPSSVVPTAAITPVPEPGTMVLVAIGAIIGIGIWRRAGRKA
jgi:autotransporter-associated beta strand protein